MNEKELLDNNVCPNCWGKQEYDGKFVAAAKDRQVDINNKDQTSTRTFIQEFMSKYVDGIRLRKDGDQRTCPACKASY